MILALLEREGGICKGDRRSIPLSLTARLNIKIHSVAVDVHSDRLQCTSLRSPIVNLTSILEGGGIRKDDGGSDHHLFHLNVSMKLLPR